MWKMLKSNISEIYRSIDNTSGIHIFFFKYEEYGFEMDVQIVVTGFEEGVLKAVPTVCSRDMHSKRFLTLDSAYTA